MIIINLSYDRGTLLKVLKDKYKSFETVVELGTNKGDFAQLLYEILEPTNIYAVDPFEVYKGAPPSRGNNPSKLQSLSKRVENRLASFNVKGEAKLIKKYSVDAALDFEDNSVDLVYIDADHTYESVKADINAWFPKVKSSGILAGHDYVPRSKIEEFGVIQAVNEFCIENDYVLFNTKDTWITWAIKKDHKVLI